MAVRREPQSNLDNQPLVSVVTPSFNSVDYIERTLDSVARQSYPNVEHIVVDGCSTDGTRAILEEWRDIILIIEPDDGQSDALNKGFQRAKGEIIGWINSDDTYERRAVQEAVESFAANPSAGMAYGHTNLIDSADRLLYHHRAEPYDMATCLTNHRTPQQSAFMRAGALRDVGYLNADLHYVMDWDLFVRLALRTDLVAVDRTWANFRQHAVSKTVSQPAHFWHETIRMFDGLFEMGDIAQPLQAQKSQAYARSYWMIGIMEGLGEDHVAQETSRKYCRMALASYPLLARDMKWVAAQTTHQAVAAVAAERREEYVRSLFDGIGLQERTQDRATRRALAHMRAALYLIQGTQIADRYEVEGTYDTSYAMAAVLGDPRWLLNRGIQIGVLKSLAGRFRRSTAQKEQGRAETLGR